MSFLIRRNLPWVWAGWADNFSRPAENPIKQPWSRWGAGSGAVEINDINELHVASNGLDLTFAGGASYEHMPFTPNWGIEFEVWWPTSTGFEANELMIFLMENWTNGNYSGAWNKATVVGLWNRPAIDGQTVKISLIPSYFTISHTVLASFASPVAFLNNYLTVKILVDADALVRAYINDQFVCQAMLPMDYRTRLGKRGFNVATFGPDAWIRWIRIFDRPSPLLAADRWTSLFYDDFNRANGAVGNGWTQLGTNAAIVNNSWSTTGTTDGGRGLLRDTGITTGRQRIEATIGGNLGPNNTAYSCLLLRGNAAGDQGIACGVFGNQLILARYQSPLSDNPTNFFSWTSTGATVASGDKVAFSAIGEIAWVEVNGQLVALAGRVSTTVPETNSYMGLRVERRSSNDSCSFNDVRLMSS